jgi:hypothetical protein
MKIAYIGNPHQQVNVAPKGRTKLAWKKLHEQGELRPRRVSTSTKQLLQTI